MTTYNAIADLGLTPGTNVTSALATFFSTTAAPGDVLHLDTNQLFWLTWTSPGFTLPANFSITANNGGGFDLRSSTTSGGAYFNVPNDNCLISNVTFRASTAPITGYRGANAVSGTDYNLQRAFNVTGNDFIFRNNDCQGQIEFWQEIEGGAEDPLIEGSRFYGGKYQVGLAGNIQRPRFFQNYFEYAMIDAIKTFMADASDPSGWIGPTSDGIVVNLEDNDFVEINRDPFDSTGGAYKFVMDGNRIFRCAFLDLKHPIKELDNPSTQASSVWNPYVQYGNVDMVIRNTYVQDYYQNVIVVTADTAAGVTITQANYDRLNIRNIAVEDTIWEFTSAPPGNPRFGLLKGGDGISSDGLTIRGYTGSYTVWSEDYDAGQGQGGDAPSGWTPDVAPTSTGATTTGTNTSPLPTPIWQKVGGAPPTTIELLGAVISVTATAV
jgi:hypothetical protein